MSQFGMLTDRYELTMLESALSSGLSERQAVFEVFGRSLRGYRYGVVAGLGRLLPMVADFQFQDRDLEWLLQQGVITARTATWLSRYRFQGDIYGYPEGELYFPNSPILTVIGAFAETIILETLILSVLNFDTQLAGQASRLRQAATARISLIEMATRRSHEAAALAVARSAYLAGFDFTSNLKAGQLYGIPTTGTAAHCFTMAHPSELDAFQAQVVALSPQTTLLVDTYDIQQGIQSAVTAAGPALGAIRIDSGDLAQQALAARLQLDQLSCQHTKIVLSGDIDEWQLADFIAHGTPVNYAGVGTRLITGSKSPGLVYKLVEIEQNGTMHPVSKRCGDKSTVGGRKFAYRRYDRAGKVYAEHFTLDQQRLTAAPLQVPLIQQGQLTHTPTLEESRHYLIQQLAQLPASAFDLNNQAPLLTTTLEATAPEPRL